MPLVSTKDDISKYLFLSERGREMDHYKMDDSVLASDWSIQFCCSSHAKIHSIVTAMMWKVSLLTRCRLKWFEFDWFYVVDQCGHLLCSVHLTVRSTLKQRDTSKMCIKKKKKKETQRAEKWTGQWTSYLISVVMFLWIWNGFLFLLFISLSISPVYMVILKNNTHTKHRKLNIHYKCIDHELPYWCLSDFGLHPDWLKPHVN